MRYNITYTQLFNIEKDIKGVQQNHPGLAFILDSKVRLFFQRAAMPLKVMHHRLKDIRDKYIQQDEKGISKTTGEGTDSKWLFLESYTDLKRAQILTGEDVSKAYFTEAEAFLSMTIEIDF